MTKISLRGERSCQRFHELVGRRPGQLLTGLL